MTRLGDFSMFWVKIWVTKVAQMYSDFWAMMKTFLFCLCNINFKKNLACFYFSIRSLWDLFRLSFRFAFLTTTLQLTNISLLEKLWKLNLKSTTLGTIREVTVLRKTNQQETLSVRASAHVCPVYIYIYIYIYIYK